MSNDTLSIAVVVQFGLIALLATLYLSVNAQSTESPSPPNTNSPGAGDDRITQLEARFDELAEQVASTDSAIAIRELPTIEPTATTVEDRWVDFEKRLSAIERRLASTTGIGDTRGVAVDWPQVPQLDQGEPSEPQQCRLVAAAREGNRELVDRLLLDGVDLQAIDSDGKTPLISALAGDYETLALDLLARGGNPRTEDGNGETPMIWAAGRGQLAMVQRLLDLGISVDFKIHSGNSALANAARNGHFEMARVLLRHGADINIENDAGETPLAIASAAKRDEIVQHLRRNGAR